MIVQPIQMMKKKRCKPGNNNSNGNRKKKGTSTNDLRITDIFKSK